MHILLIHQYFLEKEASGGARFNEMTKFWTDQGHQVTVIAGMIHANGFTKAPKYRGKYFLFEEFAPNVKVLRCHVSENYNTNFSGRLWGYFSFVLSSLLGFLLKLNYKYDLVLCTSPPLFVGITGLLISRINNIPLVFEVRDLWPESAIETGVLKSKILIELSYYLESVIYQQAQLVNVLTPAFKDHLESKKNVPVSKICVISNGCDFLYSDLALKGKSQKELKAELGWSNQFIALYVGAHGVANHLEQILDAASLLKNENILFVFIGDGMQKKFLEKMTLELKLVNVTFLAPVSKEKVFEYIKASDIGLSAMKRKPVFNTIYTNKAFDYMACKTPALIMIDGVSRKLVEESNAGLFAEPENPADISQKLLWMENHPEALHQMGEDAYLYAKKNLDRSVLSQRYLDELARFH